MVLADRAALLVSTVFGSPSDYSGGIVILAMFVYTLQIYADFAAVSILTLSLKRNFTKHQPASENLLSELFKPRYKRLAIRMLR